eukprot:12003614-Alexandrium_andersonii.AAC.1
MGPCVSAVAGSSRSSSSSSSSSSRVHRRGAREHAAPPGELRPPTVATSRSIRWSSGLGPTRKTCGGTRRPTA